MRKFLFLSLSILIMSPFSWGAPDPVKILSESRSVFSVLDNEGLNSYVAEVSLSGNAIHEQLSSLEKSPQGSPAFRVYFESPAKWRLHCNFTRDQKKDVATILNLAAPFYLAFSLPSDQQKRQMEILQQNAELKVESETIDGTDCWKLTLLPKAGQQGIMQSRGPKGEPMITVESTFWIDKSNNTVLKNFSRNLITGEDPKESTTVLQTKWEEFEGKTVPVFFKYILDGLPMYTQYFTYRQEGDYILPSSRELVIYSEESVPFVGRFLIAFDKYRLNVAIPDGIFTAVGNPS